MNGVMLNWKTSAAGLAVICTAAAHALTTGSISAADLQSVFMGIMGIFAKDASS